MRADRTTPETGKKKFLITGGSLFSPKALLDNMTGKASCAQALGWVEKG
jgi:hypothetical protein